MNWVRHTFAALALAAASFAGSADAQTPPINNGSGGTPGVGVQHGQHGGPQQTDGVAVLVLRGNPANGTAGEGAVGLNGIGFRDGRLVVLDGPAGRVNFDALRAHGAYDMSLGAGNNSGNNLRVRVEANGTLTLVGVNGATRPLEILGTTTTLDGSAAVLIRGGATAGAEAGPQGVGVNIGAEIFAGARAEASGTISIPLLVIDLQIRVNGSANAGVGASAHAGAEFRDGRARIHFDAGLTAGVGAEAGVQISVGPGSIFRPGAGFRMSPEERRRLDRLSQMTAPPPSPRTPPTAAEIEAERIRARASQMTSPPPVLPPPPTAAELEAARLRARASQMTAPPPAVVTPPVYRPPTIFELEQRRRDQMTAPTPPAPRIVPPVYRPPTLFQLEQRRRDQMTAPTPFSSTTPTLPWTQNNSLMGNNTPRDYVPPVIQYPSMHAAPAGGAGTANALGRR